MTLTKNRVMIAVVAGLMAVTLAQANTPAGQTTQNTMNPLEAKIRHELLLMPYYGVFDNVVFQVNGSEVTLTGQVVRPVLKADAERTVARVPGVTKVANNIEVLPTSRYDDHIRMELLRAIYLNSAMRQYAIQPQAPIRIIVNNGRVTLVGVVSSQMAKNVAGIEANGVRGVFSVDNQIQVVTS